MDRGSWLEHMEGRVKQVVICKHCFTFEAVKGSNHCAECKRHLEFTKTLRVFQELKREVSKR